jgi:hypothetical protein
MSGTAGGHSSAESETLQKLHAGNQAEIEAGRWMQQPGRRSDHPAAAAVAAGGAHPGADEDDQEILRAEARARGQLAPRRGAEVVHQPHPPPEPGGEAPEPSQLL